MGHRKTPSLHIRFDGFETLDTLEALANKRGEKLVPWARKALVIQARWQSVQEILQDAACFSMLESVVLLREMAGPEASSRAFQHVQDYSDKVNADVAKNFI